MKYDFIKANKIYYRKYAFANQCAVIVIVLSMFVDLIGFVAVADYMLWFSAFVFLITGFLCGMIELFTKVDEIVGE